MTRAIRIIGIDPGLRHTGWGIVAAQGTRLSYVADGTIKSEATATLPDRLMQLHEKLSMVIGGYEPEEAAVEETFVNKDARATLKLGQARGVAMLVPFALPYPPPGSVLRTPTPGLSRSTEALPKLEKSLSEWTEIPSVLVLMLPLVSLTFADTR